MIGCVTRGWLREFVAGRLSASRTQAIAEHLEVCSHCQHQLDELTDDPKLRGMQDRHLGQVEESDDIASLASLRDQLYAMRIPAASTRSAIHPPEVPEQEPAQDSDQERIPSILGRFRLRRRLGVGGFGVVYLAEDVQLNRLVALKIPRTAGLAGPEVRARFMREVLAAAGLHHPQIVALYDAGESEGVYYLASAYCPGATLAQWLKDLGEPAAPDTAALLILALAEAAEHAHEHGVLHRDIKPQNVLLDPTFTYRDLPFCPKLTDFSVAKLMDDASEVTVSYVLLGTPRYMAPEQVSGRRDLLGPTCDVYALGVVLYELLTAEAPIRGESQVDTLRRVLDDHPVRPRMRNAAVPRDLEAICLRCLQKAPDKRYPSARALAEDLQRYLDRQPTVARPIGWSELAIRSIRRHPAAASLLGAVLAGTSLALAGLLLYNSRLNEFNVGMTSANVSLTSALEASRRATARALTSESQTQQLLYVADMRVANRARLDGDMRTLSDLLRRHLPRDGQADRRGLEWRFLWNAAQVDEQLFARQSRDIYSLRVSRDGRWLAAAGREAIVRLYDLQAGTMERLIDTQQREVNGVAFSSDGERLATAGDDGTLRVWDVSDGRQQLVIAAHSRLAFGVSFMPDDAQLVSCGNEPVVRLWDARNGEPRGTLVGHQVGVEALALSPVDLQLGTAGSDGFVRIWDLTARRERFAIKNAWLATPFSAVVFAPDGGWLGAADITRNVWILSARTGQTLAVGRHLDSVRALATSSDGRYLVSGDRAGVLCLWNTASLRELLDEPPEVPAELPLLRKWSGHSAQINALQFDGDDQLFSADSHGVIQSRHVSHLVKHPPTPTHENHLVSPMLTADGRVIALSPGESLCLWTPLVDPQLEQPTRIPTQAMVMCGSPLGEWLATCTLDGRTEVWDVGARNQNGASHLTDEPSTPVPQPLGTRVAVWSIGENQDPRTLSLSADGRRLALLVRKPQNRVRLFQLPEGIEQASLSLPAKTVGSLEFSADGTRLAVRTDDDVLIWTLPDVAAGESPRMANEPSMCLAGTHKSFTNLTFSPDGTLLATCGSDRLIRFWDPDTGKLLGILAGHRGTVNAMVFSPDGRSLVSVGADGALKAWNVASREELFDLHQHTNHDLVEVAVAPDGRRLVATTFLDRRLILLELGAAHR